MTDELEKEKQEKEIDEILAADQDDDTEFLLTAEQIEELQELSNVIQKQADSMLSAVKSIAENISRITPEQWKLAFQNTAESIARNMDPDTLPPELLEDKTIRHLADLIREKEYEQAEDTILHMKGGSFFRLINALPSVTDQGKRRNPVIVREKIITELAESLSFPLDKVNAHFFQIWEDLTSAPDNQIFFDVTPSTQKTDSLSAEDRSTILLSLDKRGPHAAPLMEYDRRVYIAANALHEKNNGRPFTLQALYEQMGNTGKLGDNNREKLMNSLNSMFDYWLGLDNTQETELQRNRKKYVYHGSLLPFEYVDEYENGQVTNVHVHLLRTAPLIDFSKDRKQITTISRNLLKTPLSQTDTNLRIEHYLIQEIAGIKKGRRNNKMLYSTIFEETGQTTRKQQARAKEKIIALLAYYKEIGHILDYKTMPDGIAIRYHKPNPADKPRRRRKKTVKTDD